MAVNPVDTHRFKRNASVKRDVLININAFPEHPFVSWVSAPTVDFVEERSHVQIDVAGLLAKTHHYQSPTKTHNGILGLQMLTHQVIVI
ncbi:hypothetical protein D3C86_1812700 [compost metagenome]